MSDATPHSSYVEYLPAIFQESPFLGQFLLAFERILSEAAPEDSQPALETIIERSHTYLKPVVSGADRQQAPSEFLPWLASWVALTLREDLAEAQQRQFIRQIVPLYRLRGTKLGLQKILQIYLGENVPITIYDDSEDFGFVPSAHFFQVSISLNDRDLNELRRKQAIAIAIIEQEKPAHTFYGLQIRVPTMRLLSEELSSKLNEPVLRLGKNTLLGTGTMNSEGENE
jgi:phage tail-like protein